jgi:hypothetical protein
MINHLFLAAMIQLSWGGTVEMALPEVPREIGAARMFLLKEMQKDSTWQPNDSEEERRLLRLLGAVGDLRISELAPTLARKITYEHRLRGTISRFYPAHRALRRLGLEAIDPILSELKTFDVPAKALIIGKLGEAKTKEQQLVEDARLEAGLKRGLLVDCLIEIYDRGGFGSEIARRRVELEAAKATGKQKERLTDSLNGFAPLLMSR